MTIAKWREKSQTWPQTLIYMSYRWESFKEAKMKNQFANYVILKVLETCNNQQRELILSRIKVHLNALKKLPYGNHIVVLRRKTCCTWRRMASSSVSTSKGSTVDCYCKRPAVLGTSGTTINPGRQFWSCCNWKVKEKSCGYFRWADQIAAEAPTYTKPLTGRDEMNSRMTFVDRDELKLAMYPLVAFLSGLLVGIFLGFLLAKL